MIVGLGALLRFWQLDLKPLWLDEVITAIFSLGKSYSDIPLDVIISADALDQLFTYRPGASCGAIAQRVATDSLHPPIFFCLLYGWMGWLNSITPNWTWALRSLPALFGVGAIAALYWLNRVAVSPAAGLAGAALMAVSPFAVYLSQEARHYTLPMLVITLALTALVQIQQDLQGGQRRIWVWLGWVCLNLLGLYTHYLVAIALVAQVLALTGWMLWQRHRLHWYNWAYWGSAIAAIGVGYAPWLVTGLGHLTRPETDWLHTSHPDWSDRLAPIYQTISNGALMLIALPAEQQPWAIAIPSVLVMVAVAAWIIWQAGLGLRLRLRRGVRQSLGQSLGQSLKLQERSPVAVAAPGSDRHAALLLLLGFVVGVVVQFAVIVYGLNKDITVVPRYNFVIYPGLCALLGIGLSAGIDQALSAVETDDGRLRGSDRRLQQGGALLVAAIAGLLGSLIVVNGLAFQKSYYPDRVAQTMHIEPATPLALVVSYRSLQEVALGLSFALELRTLYPPAVSDSTLGFGFVGNQDGDGQVWKAIARLPHTLDLPMNLWVVASPAVRKRNFPSHLRVRNPGAGDRATALCDRDPDRVYRIGFPYQRYRCLP